MARSGFAGIGASIVVALAVGCAGGTGAPKKRSDAGGGPATGFPTPEKLEELAGEPIPRRVFKTDVRDVEVWELEGPFPERVDERRFDDGSSWSALLADAAEQRTGLVVPTEAMYCVARELGRFYLMMDGFPSENLQRYIVARCQAGVEGISARHLHAEIDRRISDAEVFDQWRESFETTIADQLVGGPTTAGVWFGRSGDRAIALVVSGVRAVRLEPVETVLGGDHRVVIRGESLRPAEEVGALINRGRHGIARCEPQPGVELPRFHFVCEASPSDESAWLVVDVRPAGRLLARSAANLLVWPSGETDKVYRRPTFADSEPMESEDAAVQGFVALLNSVRASAELPELILDVGQSETATALAPYFFYSWIGDPSGAAADLLALGMMAGWDVDGIVQEGHMSGSWVPESDDLATLLATALEYPISRAVLLSPDADRIAVGPFLERDEEHTAIAAVFGTYSLFSEEDHDANVQKVFRKLREARQERGRRGPQHLVDVAQLAIVAASNVQAGADPEDALGDLLQASTEILRRPVQGWVAQVADLEALEFPEDFLTDSEIGVAIGVSYVKPKGEAWGRYVVMIVVAPPRQHRV
jgi:hypothetical protein